MLDEDDRKVWSYRGAGLGAGSRKPQLLGILIMVATGAMAAPAQTSASLAALMAKIHAVRAMQLDINPEWPIFNVYNGPGARGATLTVPNPNQIPGRFLYSSTKDFFAVFVAHRPGEPQPWQ